MAPIRGIQQYAPRPPRSLTAALGREVEKYDQLCDAIESQLARLRSLPRRLPPADAF